MGFEGTEIDLKTKQDVDLALAISLIHKTNLAIKIRIS